MSVCTVSGTEFEIGWSYETCQLTSKKGVSVGHPSILPPPTSVGATPPQLHME